MIYRTDTQGLYSQINKGYSQLKNAKNSEERMALANYIGNLYKAISEIDKTPLDINEKNIFGSHKNFNKFFKKLNIYEIKMLENYVLQRDFHQDYLCSALDGVENNLLEIYDERKNDNPKTTILSIGDYYSIFHDFMDKMGQGDVFDEFYVEGKIYVSDSEDSVLRGYNLFNPVDKNTDIVIRNFHYDIHSMFTLAHEFGHVYDVSKFDDDIESYNRYFYQSTYSEVFSKLFERLFLEYLITNDILKDEAKSKLFEMHMHNYGYLMSSYMESLFDEKYQLSNGYQYLSSETIFDMIKNDFVEKEHDYIKSHIEEWKNFDIIEDSRYAYGDIISMFLKIQIDNYGFDNDLMDEILKCRSSLFDSELFDKYNMNPDRYAVLHRKETKLYKK